MKNHKYTVIWMTLICAISIVSALIFDMHSRAFWTNVFIGVFASGILILGLSVIGYLTERKRTLEEFLTCAFKAVNNFRKFRNGDDLDEIIDAILEMDKFDYSSLDNSYGSIDFLFSNKSNRTYIYESIYKRIRDLSKLISEKSWHFEQYKLGMGNLAVMKHYIDEIDREIMGKSIKEVCNDDGSGTTVTYSLNKINKELSNELTGRYYKIMYGKKAKVG